MNMNYRRVENSTDKIHAQISHLKRSLPILPNTITFYELNDKAALFLGINRA
jgi:hypothetical protein